MLYELKMKMKIKKLQELLSTIIFIFLIGLGFFIFVKAISDEKIELNNKCKCIGFEKYESGYGCQIIDSNYRIKSYPNIAFKKINLSNCNESSYRNT